MRNLRCLIKKSDNLMIVFMNDNCSKYVVKCHPEDNFDYRIGLGVAASRYFGLNNELKHLKENMTERKYYIYCYHKLFCFNEEIEKKFIDAMKKEEEEYAERQIQEQLRKKECELRNIEYKENKIEHKFFKVDCIPFFSPQDKKPMVAICSSSDDDKEKHCPGGGFRRMFTSLHCPMSISYK